ncbi:MAG: hypothetical protein PHI97_28865 [Desulfobulbus sp.]|nr:hypothetical protein [Desulfobulbus sp.]
MAVEQGYGRTLASPYFGESVGTINAALLVTRDMIEKNPEAVQKLVNAHAGATEALNRDQARWLREAQIFGTSLAVLEQAATNMELARRTWMRPLSAGPGRWGNGCRPWGVIDRQPDYDRLFDLRFVGQAASSIAP